MDLEPNIVRLESAPTSAARSTNQTTRKRVRLESAPTSAARSTNQIVSTGKRVRLESAPTSAARSTNQIVTTGKRQEISIFKSLYHVESTMDTSYIIKKKEKGRAFSATGQKTCEREKLQHKNEYDEVKSDLHEEIRGHRGVRAKYENYVFESDKREQQLKKQIRELQKILTEMVNKKENAEGDLTIERREREKEYQDAIDVLKQENGRLESECVELQEALMKLKKNFQDERKQRNQLSYKYSLLEKQSQASTNTELLQNSDGKKELMDLNHKVEELMKDKEMLHAQNQSLCRSLTTKDEKLHHVMERQLLQQVKGTDSMKVSDLQRKLTKVNQELAKQRADNSALQQVKQLLKNKFHHMEEEMKMDQENKSDEQKVELSRLQMKMESLQREKSDLIKEAEQMKLNNESQLKQQKEEIDKMKTELKKKDKLLKENDAKLKEHLKVQLDMTAHTAEQNRKYESMMSMNKDLQGQVKDLTSRLAENQGSVQLGAANISIKGNKGTCNIHVHDKPSNGENMSPHDDRSAKKCRPEIDSTESDTDSDCISIDEQESENTKTKRA